MVRNIIQFFQDPAQLLVLLQSELCYCSRLQLKHLTDIIFRSAQASNHFKLSHRLIPYDLYSIRSGIFRCMYGKDHARFFFIADLKHLSRFGVDALRQDALTDDRVDKRRFAGRIGTYQAKIYLVLVQSFLTLLKHLAALTEHLLGIIILQLVLKGIQCFFTERADRLIDFGNARQFNIINDLKNLLILGIVIIGYLLLQILIVDLRTLEGYVYVVFIKLFPNIIKEFASLILQQKLSASGSVLLQSGALVIRDLDKTPLKASAETDLFLNGMIH